MLKLIQSYKFLYTYCVDKLQYLVQFRFSLISCIAIIIITIIMIIIAVKYSSLMRHMTVNNNINYNKLDTKKAAFGYNVFELKLYGVCMISRIVHCAINYSFYF